MNIGGKKIQFYEKCIRSSQISLLEKFTNSLPKYFLQELSYHKLRFAQGKVGFSMENICYIQAVFVTKMMNYKTKNAENR